MNYKIKKFRTTKKHEMGEGHLLVKRFNDGFSWEEKPYNSFGYLSETSILKSSFLSVLTGHFEIYEIEHAGQMIRIGQLWDRVSINGVYVKFNKTHEVAQIEYLDGGDLVIHFNGVAYKTYSCGDVV